MLPWSTSSYFTIVRFLGVTVTYDAAKVKAVLRFRGEQDFVLEITTVEGTLAYKMNWPQNAGTVCFFILRIAV